MGRVRQKEQVEKAPPAEEILTPEQEAELEAQEREIEQTGEWLTEFQARFTDQPVKILVEKFDEAGDWALCRKYPLANFDPDTVRIEYGGGRYRCTLYDPKGKWVKDGRTYFKFAEGIAKPTGAAKPENPFENPIVAMMLNSQKENTNMLMAIMQSLLTAQGAGGAKATGLGEMVEVVKSINAMTPKDKPMEAFKETLGLMKLVKEVTGDSDGESKGGLLSDLKEVIEVLPLLKEHMAALKPTPAPLAPAVQITPGKVEHMDPLSKKVVELVPKFVGGAQANAPITEWGAYLLDVFDTEVLPLAYPVMRERFKALVKTEDEAYDLIIKLASDPDERATAIKQITPLMPYLPWVNQVIDEAIRLAEAPEAEVTTGGNAILEAAAANGSQKAEVVK